MSQGHIDLLNHHLGEFQHIYTQSDVLEFSLNDDGQLWLERNTGPMMCIGSMGAATAHSIIAIVADSMGTVVSTETPIVEGEFPLDGARFEGLIPPVVSRAAFSIRKHLISELDLSDYVAQGMMPEKVFNAINKAITDRCNILVVGGTGSGKTTLVNSILAQMGELCPDDRMGLIEDTREIRCKNRNKIFLRSTVYTSTQTLLKAMLRLRPDRIGLGEVRGGEALDLLMAWNTGHPGGFCTLHANSAQAGLIRLEQLVGIASATPMPQLIAEAVDLIIFIHRHKGRRSVAEALLCHGYAQNNYQLEVLYDEKA